MSKPGGRGGLTGDGMGEDLYYTLDRPKLGTAVIINNLHSEQEPTRKDVQSMAEVLKEIGFSVEIHRDLTSQGMNGVKRRLTRPALHREASCFLLLVISHGTADNFLQDTEGAKTWNIESLVTEMCDVETLVGKPKLFFLEACRGREHNMGSSLATKSSAPRTQGISLPSKQDVFVGFATVPGFVSFTSSSGSPYLQALSSVLSSHHSTTDLSDIHLLVKRRLAALHLGREGARQGAEERSSLLSKLLFSRNIGGRPGAITEDLPAQLVQAPSTPLQPGPPPPLPSLSSIPIHIERLAPSLTKKDPLPLSPHLPEDRIISQGGAGPLPRASLFSFPYTSSFPSSFSSSPLTLRPVPEVFTSPSRLLKQSSVHVIEILSSDVEAGLNQLLDRVTTVYGGQGKVKVKKRLWGGGDEGDKKKYSFKYLGPEKAACLLEKALLSVKELQGRSGQWKFTQRLEVTSVA